MLPRYLSIEGLYSYQDKQEIDFTQLTEAGLFGIFGKVGSGKSSILEAISFALYGETERLNKQEKRAYNMLNLRSDAARIVFEFFNYEGKKFRFVAQWKRRKKFEDTSTLERLAYQWENEEWIPLASSDGAAVTKLSYPNFRRTIIIPQGQFKEFLELRGKDRSDMMKEIFNLNRFDLGPKVAALQRQNNAKLHQLSGALSGFEAVSSEVLTQKQEELAHAQAYLLGVKEETTQLEQEVQRLSESKKLREQLTAKENEKQAYLAEEPRISQLEKELQQYETTQLAFRELLNTTQHLNKEKEKLTYKIEQLSVQKEKVLQELEKQETEWNAVAQDYQRIDLFRAESEDLRLLLNIRQNQNKQLLLHKRLQDGQPYLLEAEKAVQELTDTLNKEEEGLDALKNDRVDTSALLELEAWYQTYDNIGQSIREASEQQQHIQRELQTLHETFNQRSVAPDDWEKRWQQQETELQTARQQLQAEETQWSVQRKLAEFAENLQEGQPCPLCGALDHPAPMVQEELAEQLAHITARQQSLQQQVQKHQADHQFLSTAAIRLSDKQTQLTQLTNQLERLNEKQEAHRALFVWEGFSSSDKSAFLAYKDKNQLTETHIKQGEARLKALRQELQTGQTKIEKYKKSLAEFEQQIGLLDQLNEQYVQQLRRLNPSNFESYNEAKLHEQKAQTEARVNMLEETHKRLSESIQLLRTDFARINGERSAAKEQFQQLYQQISSKQAEVSNLLRTHGYNDIIQVQHILQKNIDVQRTRKTTQEFRVNLQIVLRDIASLEERVSQDDYQETVYTEKTTLYGLKREELELQIRVTGSLEKEYSQLRVEFEKKEKLREEYEKLSLRKSNLTTLDNLFRGSGFVNYVSSIHLQQLCEIANQRFHRLTKNNLSLSINENNEFEVIDFLNNGFKRSVKTLSGGQAFQASLCLALALAENIQSMNKADKNFFFIDEGFGTQDPESMNTVFETLQYLHKDNRIVGIISHVEELKERISRAVTVVNDIEKGSQLFSS